MPIQSDSPAPYTAPKTIIGLIETYRDRGLTTPFTLDVLIRAGITESMAPRTLQALKLLGLVDDEGEPTPQFVDLRKAAEDDVKARLQAIVRSAYEEVFSFIDPVSDSQQRIRDAFRSYTPLGQQDRMVTLFMGLCKYAEIIPPNPDRQRATRGGSAPRREPRKSSSSRTRQGPADQASGQEARTRRYDLPSTGVLGSTAGGHPLIQGLLRELPPVGASWQRAKLDAWLELQRAVFNLLYTVVDDDRQQQIPVPEGGGE